VTVAGFFFSISSLEWVAVVLCIASVFALEAVNTALEYLTDLASPEFHPLAGKAKDVAAGAGFAGGGTWVDLEGRERTGGGRRPA